MKLYHLYGLAVASEFDCPELAEITSEQAAARNYATVHLVRADAPLTLAQGRQFASWMHATPDACLYQIGSMARILVERPDRITVEMLPEAAESDMRAYLFGTGFGTLLHMRGLIPLHISAIKTPTGVVAYTGPSGAGKSTKVAGLYFKHGWPIICDDVAVLHPDDDQPLLHAGMNRLKLWKDAVERFGIDPSRLTRDFMRDDKFHLAESEIFERTPRALDRLIELGRSEKDKLLNSNGASAFTLLMNSIYRPELASLFGDRRAIFTELARKAQAISICESDLP